MFELFDILIQWYYEITRFLYNLSEHTSYPFLYLVKIFLLILKNIFSFLNGYALSFIKAANTLMEMTKVPRQGLPSQIMDALYFINGLTPLKETVQMAVVLLYSWIAAIPLRFAAKKIFGPFW